MPDAGGMELHAPSHWLAIDFISDLHLQAQETTTFLAWQNYMRHTAADAVFILGDLFEVWVGDDVLSKPSGFERECADTLRAAAQRIPIYILHGNRDFLMGPALMQQCGTTLLPDPSLLCTTSGRWLLTHGDELCVGDTDYQAFRRQVRSSAWQAQFLAQPLDQRLALARQLRAQSEARKMQDTEYADVDTDLALAWLRRYGAAHMIHGHTHQPGYHHLDGHHDRTVLSDWDLNADPVRAEVLRLDCRHHNTAESLRRLTLREATFTAAN